MMLKRGFTSAMLLLLVIVLAGCSTMFPGPSTPPVDFPHGALDLQVDLAEIIDTPFMPTEVAVTLTRGSNTIDDSLPITDGFAQMLFERLDAATWSLMVRLTDGADASVTWSDPVEIRNNETVQVQLRAKLDGGALSLVPADGDAGQDPGEE